MWRVEVGVSARTAALRPITQIAVLATGGFLLAAGDVSAGDLLAASRYALLGAGAGTAVSHLHRLARARPAARRIAAVLARPRLRYGDRDLPDGPGRLEFRGVTAGPLRDVDLVVPEGLTVALVGRPGAGASLLAALAGRLAEPEAGRVLLDGVPLADLSHRALRTAVCHAFARPAPLGRTLQDMIAFGAAGPGDRHGPEPGVVRAAARAAGADGFVRRLPRGYDTPPAEAPLSAGDAQRLGLARAFAHRGRLLIFDDALPGLDTVTGLQVGRAITDELCGRTRIIVARRASTAKRADLVAWLDGGGVRAVDRHDRLWREPDYRSVFQPGPSPAAHPDTRPLSRPGSAPATERAGFGPAAAEPVEARAIRGSGT
jgi:ATP-binding cassette subfamily B protein